jgi:hypothetical protein
MRARASPHLCEKTLVTPKARQGFSLAGLLIDRAVSGFPAGSLLPKFASTTVMGNDGVSCDYLRQERKKSRLGRCQSRE